MSLENLNRNMVITVTSDYEHVNYRGVWIEASTSCSTIRGIKSTAAVAIYPI